MARAAGHTLEKEGGKSFLGRCLVYGTHTHAPGNIGKCNVFLRFVRALQKPLVKEDLVKESSP